MAKAESPNRPTEQSFNRRGFWALIVTQFQGAFNDNLYQYLIIFFLLSSYRQAGGGELVFGRFDPEDFVPSFATLLFSLPFILFPSFFGALADRYSKQRVALSTKYIEIVIMALGGLAFWLGQPMFIWAILLLMATQSTMFGPAKYGILPETLPEARLSWGNGILQMGTIIAIIAGTGLAGPLYKLIEGRIYLASLVLVGLSCFGAFMANFMSKPQAANPAQRLPFPLLLWRGMGPYFKTIWRDKILLNVVLGYIYFWFAGALIRQNVIKFSGVTLQVGEDMTSFLLVAVAIGIGFGAITAGFLSRGKIEMGMVPLGAGGMMVFSVMLAIPGFIYETLFFGPLGLPLPTAYYALIGFSIFGLGFFAGFFDVPLAAAIQQRAPANMKGGVIATTNMLTFVGMAGSSLLFLSLGSLGLSPYGIFFIGGLFSLGMGLYISIRIPNLLLRAALWLLTNSICRLRVQGRIHLPETGGALLVANHISFIDALFIMFSTDRPVYFVMGKAVYDVPWMRFIARALHIVPVNPEASPEQYASVIAEIRTLIAGGDLVCVNAEKQLSANGTPVPWHADYGQLCAGLDAPVLPVYLSRLWETFYAFKDNRFLWKWPGWGREIWMNYGEPMPEGASGLDTRDAIRGLMTHSYIRRPLRHKTLHQAFLPMARRHLRRMAIADATTGELSYFKTLVGSIVFARKLKKILDDAPMTGVLVPPSVGGTLTNIALQMLGKVPVNLNYTTTPETMAACARQCGITQVLTSRRFLERLPLQVPGETILLEDIRETVSGKDRIIGMLLALLLPARLFDWFFGAPKRSDADIATIIFSSGSEGEPKGIMLSHRTILTQTETVACSFPHDAQTGLMGFLPFFHSFGFTGTLWMPLVHGVRGIFHPSPLEPRIIGDLIKKYKANVLIGTPTFLQGFLRRCTPEQMASLDFVVTGAEKLPGRVRLAFKETFGVEPMEGYGATECGPVVSMNTADCESPGFFWRGLRHGTIGRPLQGQSVRIVSPETGEILPLGEAGLMQVRGPNIMLGYLNLPEKTAAALHDGWYSTGDIATIDDEEFITITDRLARFSKIAGEMVPHTKVEELLHGMLDLNEPMLAVASVPDPQKGERLVVLHTLSDDQLARLLEKLDQSDLPNLWRPRPNAFHRIDALPVLGTGKMDIRGVKKMAMDMEQ